MDTSETVGVSFKECSIGCEEDSMTHILFFDIGTSFNNAWVEERLPKKVKAKASRSESTSLINDFPEESKIHVSICFLPRTIRTG